MEEKKKTYYKESQKKYNEKNTIYSVKYLHSESEKVEQIEKAIANSGKSKSQWIKLAIESYLQK